MRQIFAFHNEHPDTTIWFSNLHYWENRVNKHELVLRFAKSDLPSGYDQVTIDWGDGVTPVTSTFSGDGTQDFLHKFLSVGTTDIKITLSSSSDPTTYPAIEYKFKDFNQDLIPCAIHVEVDTSTKETPLKNYCMQNDVDTLYLRLLNKDDNPTLTKYIPQVNVSPKQFEGIEGRRDTLYEDPDSIAPGVYKLIIHRPTGSYQFKVGFLERLTQNGSSYFLQNNSDFKVLTVYSKPRVHEIFNFKFNKKGKKPDAEGDTIRICAGEEPLKLDSVYLNTYQDWIGMPTMASRMKFEYFQTEDPNNPVWEKITGLAKDSSVVDSAKRMIIAPGFYKIKITAENLCGIDSMETDSVRNSPIKQAIEVQEEAKQMRLFSDRICVQDNPEVILIDTTRRIKYEADNIDIAVTQTYIDQEGKEQKRDIKYKVSKKKWFSHGVAVDSIDKRDSTVYTIDGVQGVGVFTIAVDRKNSVCGESKNSLELRQGDVPAFKSESPLIDSLRQKGYVDLRHQGNNERLWHCDTFTYYLNNFSPAVDTNVLTLDSIRMAFLEPNATAADTILLDPDQRQKYRFSKALDANAYKVTLMAQNICGVSAVEANVFVAKQPRVKIIRDGLPDIDTLCLGMTHHYSVEGELPNSFYPISVSPWYIDPKTWVVGGSCKEYYGSPTGLQTEWDNPANMTGNLAVKEVFQIINAEMGRSNPMDCMQEIVDTVFFVDAPDRFIYDDSLWYCKTSVTQIQTADIFQSPVKNAYKWAEWRWRDSKATWQKGATLPTDFTLTNQGNDTLTVNLSVARGCSSRDTLVFIGKTEPTLDVQKNRDTVCVVDDVDYPVWGSTLPFPADNAVLVNLTVKNAANNVVITQKDSVKSDYVLPVTTETAGDLELVYSAYYGGIYGNGCEKEINTQVHLLKPHLNLTKQLDTLSMDGSGSLIYDFSRRIGYLDSAYIDKTTIQWVPKDNLHGTIVNGKYQVNNSDLDLEALVFYIEATTRGASCGGVKVRDSLMVYAPIPRLVGGRWNLCDNATFPLWDDQKKGTATRGYFVDKDKVVFNLLNGAGSEQILGSGANAQFIPDSKVHTGLNDTVRIRASYEDAVSQLLVEDTVYLKINPAPTMTLNVTELLAKQKQVDVNKIDPQYLSYTNQDQIIFSDITGQDAYIQTGDKIAHVNEYSKDNEAVVTILLKAKPGCADIAKTVKIIDLLPVGAKKEGMIPILCEGNKTPVLTASLVDYSAGHKDAYTKVKWEKLGADGRLSLDGTEYYVEGIGNDHQLRFTAWKECTYYDGTPSDADYLKETLLFDDFITLHDPMLHVGVAFDTICFGNPMVFDVINKWDISLGNPDYKIEDVQFNGSPLTNTYFQFPGYAGQTLPVEVSIPIDGCQNMSDWGIKSTVSVTYQQKMMTGTIAIKSNICGENPTLVDMSGLTLKDYSSLEWKAYDAVTGDELEAEFETPEGQTSPNVIVRGDAQSGRVTLLIHAPRGCSDDYVSTSFTRTVLPEIDLGADQNPCAIKNQPVTIPIDYLKKKESISRIEWYLTGSTTPFKTLTGDFPASITYVPSAADIQKGAFGVEAKVVSTGSGCDPTGDKLQVTFKPVPKVEILDPAPTVCQGDKLALDGLFRVINSDAFHTEMYSDSKGTLDEHYYYPGDEAKDDNYFVVWANDTVGCDISSTKVDVKVNVMEVPALAKFTTTEQLCPQVALLFTAPDPTLDYIWTFGDGSKPVDKSSKPTHVYAEPGKYVVEMKARYKNGCSRSVVDTLQVGEKMNPGLHVVPELEGCHQAVRYVEDLTEGAWTLASINWGDSDEWQVVHPGIKTLSHRYSNETPDVIKRQIKWLVQNSCGSEAATAELSVYPVQAHAFASVSDSAVYADKCAGNKWGFLNRSFGFGDADYHGFWTVDGETSYPIASKKDTLMEHLFTTPGKHTVLLTVGDRCNEDTVTRVVTVWGNDSLDFSLPSQPFCSGQELAFALLPNLQGQFSDFEWTFGDGETDNHNKMEVNHTYMGAADYHVTLKARAASQGLCPAEISHKVVVNATPKAKMLLTDTHGCVPFDVHFIRDGQPSEGEQVSWTLGNGSMATGNDVPSVVYTQPGDYEVWLKILSEAGCADSIHQTVAALKTPKAAFELLNGEVFCSEDGVFEVQLANQSDDMDENTYWWTYNDKTYSRDAQPTEPLVPDIEPKFGLITIKLVATNKQSSCEDVVTHDITSAPQVKADFSVTPHEICDNTPVHFESSSEHSSDARWDMGDGNTVAGNNFDYVYDGEGEYKVKIKASSQYCEGEKEETVIVYPLPKADFSWDKDNTPPEGLVVGVTLPEVNNGGVQFSNISDVSPKTWGSSMRYVWDFGDSTATDVTKSPYHRYGNNGTYRVVLTVVTEHGCVDSVADYVVVEAVKGLFIPTAFAPGMPDENMGEGGDYRGTARFQPKGAGLYSYKIQVYDAWGGCVWSSDKLEDGHPAEYWNGDFNGAPAPKGNYTWRVVATFVDGSIWDNGGGKTEGSVMLIR